ncbi:efflux RND transporter permease subunit [Microbulbifer taiwanensis]|uniref:efflux RND transporter permease subunit n=1 Tax=Microbulbifer taiwanensis TaxID=986746 RepID=UPI003621C766
MDSRAIHGSGQTDGIIAWFAANPVAANLLMLLVMALGLMQMGALRREAFPSTEPSSITISVSYDSGSAGQSEEGVAIKIEEQLEGVTGIKSVTSASTGSGATVTVEKQSGYDLDRLLTDVRAKVDAISSFPAEAKNPVIEKARRREHALWLQLYSDGDRHRLQQLAEQLKGELLESAAISQVSLSGWQNPMMAIEIDEARLQAHGLTLSDVEEAIRRGSTSTRTAVLRNENSYLQLEAAQQAYTAADFAALPLISAGDGRQLTIGDVALVRDTFDESTPVLSRYNYRDSIAVQVIAGDGDDISRSVDAARQVVERWRSGGVLPRGVELATWYDRSESIDQRLQLLGSNALTGILLVFVVLALFLNLQVAFWVAAGLPFIVLGTLYFMGDSALGLGLTLNEFTTLGFIMALGIVVDDAIVVGESVYTRRSVDGDSLRNTIGGTLDVAKPTLFGIFTTVVAFTALSNVSGMLGELYAQFAVIVTLCLLLSMVESKLILPAHLAHLNTRAQAPKSAPAVYWRRLQRCADRGLYWFGERCYAPAIRWALRQRYAVVVLFTAVFFLVVSMPLTGTVRFSFFPDIPGETVSANITMASDASFGLTHANLERMELQAYEADRQLRGQSPGQNAIAHLQLTSESDQAGKITLQLAADSPYDANTFTRRWRELIGQPEGARSISVYNSPQMADALRIELRAADDDTLTRAGSALKEKLQDFAGVSGIEDNLEPGQPQLNLALNQQGRALGLTTSDLSTQVLQAFSGQIVQRYQRDSDEIEVKVRYPESSRQSPADIRSARVRTGDGNAIPLSAVADISYGYTRDTITRIDGKRAVYLSADVDKQVIPTPSW